MKRFHLALGVSGMRRIIPPLRLPDGSAYLQSVCIAVNGCDQEGETSFYI